MLTPYSFMSDEEPTDEELQELMAAALVDVKARAEAANAKFKALQKQQIEDAIEARNMRLAKNG